MAATLFVQPLDLVKNRMQLSGWFSVLCSAFSIVAIWQHLWLFRTWISSSKPAYNFSVSY